MIKIEIRIVSQSSRLILEAEKHAGRAGGQMVSCKRSSGLHLSLGNARRHFCGLYPTRGQVVHGFLPSGAPGPTEMGLMERGQGEGGGRWRGGPLSGWGGMVLH